MSEVHTIEVYAGFGYLATTLLMGCTLIVFMALWGIR